MFATFSEALADALARADAEQRQWVAVNANTTGWLSLPRSQAEPEGFMDNRHFFMVVGQPPAPPEPKPAPIRGFLLQNDTVACAPCKEIMQGRDDFGYTVYKTFVANTTDVCDLCGRSLIN